MGRHVESLLDEWNADGKTGRAEDLALALANDRVDHEAACAWKPRPPTPEELRAHHEAHAGYDACGERGAGSSWWICREIGAADLEFEEIEDPDAVAWWRNDGWEWRPATAEGVVCGWPRRACSEPTGEVEVGHE